MASTEVLINYRSQDSSFVSHGLLLFSMRRSFSYTVRKFSKSLVADRLISWGKTAKDIKLTTGTYIFHANEGIS